MSYIPTDVINIILQYYAELRDLKWAPFIETKNGKLVWKTNKYATKWSNLKSVLCMGRYGVSIVDLHIEIVSNNVILDRYTTNGTRIALKAEKYNPSLESFYKMISYIKSDDFSIFCSSPCRWLSRGSPEYAADPYRHCNYDVYQDNAIFGKLIYIDEKHIFTPNNPIYKLEYHMLIDKY